MKKIILIIALAINTICYCQNLDVFGDIGLKSKETIATTEKEYNYLTKGLKIQMESGLDVIAGYSLSPLSQRTYGTFYNFNAKYFINNGKVKAISIIIDNTKTKSKTFFCLPINNPTLFNQYLQMVYNLDSTTSSYFIAFYSDFTSYFVSTNYNK